MEINLALPDCRHCGNELIWSPAGCWKHRGGPPVSTASLVCLHCQHDHTGAVLSQFELSSETIICDKCLKPFPMSGHLPDPMPLYDPDTAADFGG